MTRHQISRLFVVAAVLTACRPTAIDLDVGDNAPAGTEAGGDVTVVLFVTSPADLVGCPLQDGFVALRAAQRAPHGAAVLTLLVTPTAADTVALSRDLARERIASRIKGLSPPEARRIFDPEKLPAIYLIVDRRIVREWESLGRGAPTMQRNEIVDALADVWNQRSRESIRGPE